MSRWIADGHTQAIERFLNQRPRSAWSSMWPLTATVALAAIGNQELTSLAFDIVSLPKQRLAALPDGGSYLDSYCAQLRHLAGPVLVSACRAALDGADSDAQAVLAGIGTREAFALMVDIAANPDREVSQTAAALLERAAGATFPGPRADTMARWRARGGRTAPRASRPERCTGAAVRGLPTRCSTRCSTRRRDRMTSSAS